MPVGFPDYYGGLTLPVTVPEGGTGQTSITANALLYGAGTSKLIETNVGTANQVLQINATSLLPTFQDLVISASEITGILPIAHGGTGSATAGNNIPSSLPVPVSEGGTGYAISTYTWDGYGNIKAVTGLTTGSNIALYDTNGNSLITFILGGSRLTTIYDLALSTPLPIASGGTGTSAPALTAGSNISITGTWPNNTIAIVTSPTVSDLTVNGQLTNSYGGYLYQNNAGSDLEHGLTISRSDLTRVWNLSQRSSTESGSAGPYGLMVYSYDGSTYKDYLAFNFDGTISFLSNSTSPFIAQADVTGLTSSDAGNTLYTTPNAGMYRVSGHLWLDTTTPGTGNDTLVLSYVDHGVTFTITLATIDSSYTGNHADQLVSAFYADSGSLIGWAFYSISGQVFTADVHLRLEAL